MLRFVPWLAVAAGILALGSCIRPAETANRTFSSAAVYTGVSPTGYIPPGSVIQIRTSQDIRTDEVGTAAAGVLTRDLIGGNGTVVAPVGSPVRLVILDFTDGGATTSGQVQLGLVTITVNGRTYRVRRLDADAGPLGTLVEAPRGVIAKGEALQVPRAAILTFQTDEPIYVQ